MIYGQCVCVLQNVEYSFIAEWVYLQPYLIGMCVFVHNVCVCIHGLFRLVGKAWDQSEWAEAIL